MATWKCKNCFCLTKDGAKIKIGDAFIDDLVDGASTDTRERKRVWDEYHNLFMPPTMLVKAMTDADALASVLDYRPQIENVIFNPPATIVFWSDNTKTIVKCQDGDEWDAEKGLAMAIAKKYFGNRGRYNKEFQKWLPESEEESFLESVTNLLDRYREEAKRCKKLWGR